MRRLPIIIILCFAWFLAQASPATDLRVIKKRLQTSFATGNPSSSEVDRIIGDLTATGQFSEVDYDNTEFNSGGEKRKHLANVTKLAKAYVNSADAPHFKSKGVYEAISKALSYWVDANLQDENWWHRVIAFPKDLMVPLLLVGDDLKRFDKALFDKCMEYELYSWGEPKQRAQEGANGTDICKLTFTTAVIRGDDALLTEIMAKVNTLIRVVYGDKEEGIQADYSFSQHTASGRQLYLATYGREYMDGVLYFMELVNGTSFQLSPEKVDIFERLFLDGVAWAWYKNEMDASQCGRKIVDENTAPSFVKLAQRLYALNTPRKQELKVIIDMMGGKGQLMGNKMYWRHDYMLHRGDGYMTTARMTSTRTVGNEAGNGQGFENYHTGDGANYIKVKGNEYSPIYALWNWKHIPGTTVMDDKRKMTQPMWGAGGEGHNDYASGASDTRNGVSAFIYEKDSLKAHKSWFFFDKYFVALGAGITSVRTDAPAVTTINQTTLAGDVALFDGSGSESKLASQSSSLGGLWHNHIGYKFIGDATPYMAAAEKSGKSNILWIAVTHGTAPVEATYSYAVYPNISKSDFVSKAEAEYSVLANTPKVQAVVDNASGKIMAAFYSAGELDCGAIGVISVDAPSIIIVEPTGGKHKVTVANPFCESRKQESVTVKIADKSETIKFVDQGSVCEM